MLEPSCPRRHSRSISTEILLPHRLRYGLYVVGWFVCDVWQSPRNSLESSTLEDGKAELQELAKATVDRHPDVTLAGILLDCRYR